LAPEAKRSGTVIPFVKYRQKKGDTIEKFFVEIDFGFSDYCRRRYLCASDI
jgi:hypothetical protein